MIHLGRLVLSVLRALCGSEKGPLYEEEDFKKAAKAGEQVCDACVAQAMQRRNSHDSGF